MSVESIVDEISAEQGWNTDTLLDLVLEYITNQQDDTAFEDFLRERASFEDAL